MSNHMITQDNETLFPNWQKESWQTFEETSGYVRPERVNKWPNCMRVMMMMMMMMMMMIGYVRPERVNKWPNCMRVMMMMMMMISGHVRPEQVNKWPNSMIDI